MTSPLFLLRPLRLLSHPFHISVPTYLSLTPITALPLRTFTTIPARQPPPPPTSPSSSIVSPNGIGTIPLLRRPTSIQTLTHPTIFYRLHPSEPTPQTHHNPPTTTVHTGDTPPARRNRPHHESPIFRARSDRCTSSVDLPHDAFRRPRGRHSTGSAARRRSICRSVSQHSPSRSRLRYPAPQPAHADWGRDVVQGVQSKCRGRADHQT